jgi:hypothetical protein
MRPIETAGFASLPVPDTFGPAPDLRWIEIANLVVDDTYQRPLAAQGRANVRRIVEGFDWRRFATVVVSPVVGGRFAIVDGQHRTTAAALCGIESVPCQVIIADRIEQARAFEAINGAVTRISAVQLYRARLAAGDEGARTIDRLTRDAGVEVLRYNAAVAAMKPNQTTAIGALYRLLGQVGEQPLRRCLAAIMASAADISGTLRASIITAVTEVLTDHREWLDNPRLHVAMADVDLITLEEAARARAATVRGTTTTANLQAALITHLDKAMPDARRPQAAE